MAEGVTVVGNDVVCRFFATSSCRDGQKCPFSHDRSKAVHDNVCRFYLQGRCVYGSYCRYDHVRLQPKNASDGGKTDCGRTQQAAPAGRGTDKSRTGAPSTKIAANLANNNNSPNSRKFAKGPGSSDWVNAPEFVPKSLKCRQSYADVARPADLIKNDSNKGQDSAEDLLCPYFIHGDCPYGEHCSFIHGEMCDICHKSCLLPFDKDQQKKHRESCEKEFEKDMEESFAIQRSMDKTCGICFDVIMEKQPISERRFGILEKCNHIFCLSCIRTWRKLKNGDSRHSLESSLDPVVTRTCPECRVTSDFVTPSKYWVENEEEKQKIIKEYKEGMSKKHCKYFKQGQGTCPFAGACFYLHARPDGTKVELPPPVRRPRQNQNGELEFPERIFLWDFLELRDEVMMGFEWEDMFITDSDDSDRSDIMD